MTSPSLSWLRLLGSLVNPLHLACSRFMSPSPVVALGTTHAGPQRGAAQAGWQVPAYRRRSCAPVATRPLAASPRRLRVVRLAEGDVGSGQAGRMVISGRMADVCAELDRLAHDETAVH